MRQAQYWPLYPFDDSSKKRTPIDPAVTKTVQTIFPDWDQENWDIVYHALHDRGYSPEEIRGFTVRSIRNALQYGRRGIVLSIGGTLATNTDTVTTTDYNPRTQKWTKAWVDQQLADYLHQNLEDVIALGRAILDNEVGARKTMSRKYGPVTLAGVLGDRKRKQAISKNEVYKTWIKPFLHGQCPSWYKPEYDYSQYGDIFKRSIEQLGARP